MPYGLCRHICVHFAVLNLDPGLLGQVGMLQFSDVSSGMQSTPGSETLQFCSSVLAVSVGKWKCAPLKACVVY